jgi:hypothetical protein
VTTREPTNLELDARLRAVEDRLDIYNLIAAHPPSADSSSGEFAASFWTEDGIFDQDGNERAAVDMTIRGFSSPHYQASQAQGMAHFVGLPHITIDGDTATVISYLQILAPDINGRVDALPGHKPTKGYRVHRLTANRWDLVRAAQGWRIKRRTLRLIDDSQGARHILRTVAELNGAPASS